MLAELVRPSIDYVRHKRFRSGNFPSSLSNESDRLVHWCHGAPGVIHMLIMAYKCRLILHCFITATLSVHRRHTVCPLH
ncbi:LanC-like protein 2 [Goodea atripinnis]|uniref:LanC-like protein 2 n=1 Tax=Goodea atripinnis TaxID=208336 RepID=A0ABV0N429_9TELE